MNDPAKFTMDAHGGLHRWRQLKTVPARLSNGGVFWGLKGKDGILNDVHGTADSRKEWAGRDRVAAEAGLSDTDYTTCLNVSSASLVFAGDAAYSDVHPYLIEANAQHGASGLLRSTQSRR